MNECDDESKDFLFNISLIKALLQFLPLSEKKKVQEWVARLTETDDQSDYKIRNEYCQYLLVCVQNGTINQPFSKPPVTGKLKPLCRILTDFVYEDVQKQLKACTCQISKMLKTSTDSYELPDLRCNPSDFSSEQPRPLKGVTASLAVFSNYEDEEK